ncbi:BQ2448_3065 [Microbotryum intermedium]|uniref:BQ2448_3065 protein n=1 Tax=Microbotryum intermedium TaxID=269621 RepID=A0A238FE44_9BASI|nr:BQ2448_3065 [Microbotryum intermedium]
MASMTSQPMSQEAALERFSSSSFFILTGLTPGSEFGIDGKIWQVNHFSGVKFLPPGLHFFVFSSNPSISTSSNDPDSGDATPSGDPTNGLGLRSGLLRFYLPDRTPETIVKEWDHRASALKNFHPTKRRNISSADATTSPTTTSPTTTIVSDEYLKSLDRGLAPFEDGLLEQWSVLVDCITEDTLARVIGVDEQGCAIVDATMPSNMDEKELRAAEEKVGKRQWGKQRQETEEDVVESDASKLRDDDERLMFVEFDLKKSWPEGAIGHELSIWSRDKSWAMNEAVQKHLKGGGSRRILDVHPNTHSDLTEITAHPTIDFKSLLGELQLSFLLFTQLHNFSSLPIYTSLIQLISQSSSIYSPDHASSSSSLPMLASHLSILRYQLLSLDDEFFSLHLPSLSTTLTKSLQDLQKNLSDVSQTWLREIGTSAFVIWQEVVKRWDRLTADVMERFGWEVAAIRGGMLMGSNLIEDSVGRVPRGMENAQLGWDDDDELEEGEDAPVVVELDEYDTL